MIYGISNMLIEDHGDIVTILFMVRPPKDQTELWHLTEVCKKLQELIIQYENPDRLGPVLSEGSSVSSATKLC
jgi:hypothetical protein